MFLLHGYTKNVNNNLVMKHNVYEYSLSVQIIWILSDGKKMMYLYGFDERKGEIRKFFNVV